MDSVQIAEGIIDVLFPDPDHFEQLETAGIVSNATGYRLTLIAELALELEERGLLEKV